MQYSNISRHRKRHIGVAEIGGRRKSWRYEAKFISSIFLQAVVASLLYTSPFVRGQLIGTDICGCQPATYTFTFNFSLTCNDNNVEGTPGVNDTACLIEVRGKDEVPEEDLIPVSVQTVQIFELDENQQVFSQTVRTGTFLDGSNFTYTSVISTITDLSDLDALPRGLQLVITGVNNKEEATINTYIITYTNDCGIFPILVEGQTSGWTIFSDLGDPPSTVCPAVPSMAPVTVAPTTFAPSATPSGRPSVAPITPDSPTRSPFVPTAAPMLPETLAPVPIETNAPITEPVETDAPVIVPNPTCAPVHGGGGGKGDDGTGGKGKGKGNDSGKGGKGKGEESGKGGKGKGKGTGENGSTSMGKGGKGEEESIQKKKVYDGKMDRLSTENQDRLLATGGGGGVECPEIPDDDYYLGGGKGVSMGGKGKGKGKGGKGTSEGKGGKGDSNGKGGKGAAGSKGGNSGKGDSNGKGGKGDAEGKGGSEGKQGKGGSEGKGDSKGKGEDIPMKKSKEGSGKMEMSNGTGKGKHKTTDDNFDDDYNSGEGGKQ